MTSATLIAAFIALVALSSASPAAAQSDDTCIAYMEADAAYEAAEKKANNDYKIAKDGVEKGKLSMRDRLLSKNKSLEELKEKQKALEAKIKDIEIKIQPIIEKKQVLYKRLIATKQKLAYPHARALTKEQKAALAQLEHQILAKMHVLRKPLSDAETAIYTMHKEGGDLSHQYARARSDALDRIKDKVDVVYEEELISIEKRRDAAIEAAGTAWGRAYGVAYQGPTSDIQSIFQKLVLADRERCRARFGQ